jgi:hypothetical protein
VLVALRTRRVVAPIHVLEPKLEEAPMEVAA